ncbi:hypothetical protein E1293_22960 [Actinomadura darangshiensis]|uniref:DUF1795 domain-containing protein n=1 Tax=Actinomadura darangshiensis TaxID=705336 RepID=A0A4R5B4A7_9ACTN|nr:hypothetical protein [Actinomadura darangshiensis]TDD79609.1 hypothetical protein E1293_22960 [Actinomadura darangshiensis]
MQAMNPRRMVTRSLPALALAVAGAATVVGCGGDDGKAASPASPASKSTASAQLDTYKGAGFTIGYPANWKEITGHTVVPKAAFEVGVKSRDGQTMESSFDVLVNEDLPFPLARIADDFVAFSHASKEFRLIGNRKIELDGAEAWEIRKRYKSPQGQELVQADLFTKTPQGKVVDVRIIFLSSLYDSNQPLVASIRSSFRFNP